MDRYYFVTVSVIHKNKQIHEQDFYETEYEAMTKLLQHCAKLVRQVLNKIRECGFDNMDDMIDIYKNNTNDLDPLLIYSYSYGTLELYKTENVTRRNLPIIHAILQYIHPASIKLDLTYREITLDDVVDTSDFDDLEFDPNLFE